MWEIDFQICHLLVESPVVHANKTYLVQIFEKLSAETSMLLFLWEQVITGLISQFKFMILELTCGVIGSHVGLIDHPYEAFYNVQENLAFKQWIFQINKVYLIFDVHLCAIFFHQICYCTICIFFLERLDYFCSRCLICGIVIERCLKYWSISKSDSNYASIYPKFHPNTY